MYWTCSHTHQGPDCMWDIHWAILPLIFSVGTNDYRATMYSIQWDMTHMVCLLSNMLFRPANILL